MSEKPTMETVDSLRQMLRVAERVKQAAIDCTKSWDTILDELVWERQDLDAHEIPADHLQTMIARYPHHAEALTEFAARWNADKPLSDEELASMEVDEESVKRSTAQCLLMLKWADRIRNAERERDETKEALREYHTAMTTPYPKYQEGRDAQNAWAERIDKAEERVRAILDAKP